MALYRVKQFFWALSARIDSGDFHFISLYLNPVEIDLFSKLPLYEQKHSIRVAEDVSEEYNLRMDKLKISKEVLVKAALLHDIGKIEGKLNIIEKSILVIGDKLSKGKMKKISGVKKINLFYNHAEIGFEILKKYGYDERFLYLVRNHHNCLVKDDLELKLLIICDSRN